MTKTLVVATHYPLLEATGGDMRTMHFVRFFRQFGEVDIAYSFGPAQGTPREELVRSELQLSLRAGSFGHRLVSGLVAMTPMPIYRYERAARVAFTAKVVSEQYDYILLRYAYTSGLLRDLPPPARARTILDLDDNIAGSLYDHLTDGLPRGARRRVLEINRSLLRQHEARSARTIVTTVCSDEDRTRFRGRSQRLPFVVPNIYAPAVTTRARDHGDGFGRGHRLLFVGTLSYPPNALGLLWFLKTIFPSFRRAYPTASLVVIGRGPTIEVQSICALTEGVTLIPDAPEVLPHYREARAVVVPLLAGGGTRIKILEAAFAQRPVISTPIGAEGLGFANKKELLLFDDATEFLRAYDELRDEPTYRGLVSNAKALLEAKYSARGFDSALSAVVAHLDGTDTSEQLR